MRFSNPTNGYIEEAKYPFLGFLLFGPVYFVVKGVWRHALIYAATMASIAAAVVGFTYDPERPISAVGLFFGTSLVGLPVIIGYLITANGIVRRNYLRTGWVEIDAAGNQIAP